MAGNWDEPERMWDEYDWERFLQQQDGKTEKYMQLLETYLDDPRRDETADEEEESGVDNAAASGETFQEHDLYRAAFDLTLWIDQLFDQNASLQNEPAAVKLATHAALASAKLAAALS